MNQLKKRLENEIIAWNNRFPLDYWWRKKYRIPFGSKQHREMSHIDMYKEYLEDKMMREKAEQMEAEEKGMTMTSKEVDDAFENLDLSKYNDKDS